MRKEDGQNTKRKKSKTKYLHYWEDIIDLVPRADVFSNQGPNQEFSLHRTEMVEVLLSVWAAVVSSKHILSSNHTG